MTYYSPAGIENTVFDPTEDAYKVEIVSGGGGGGGGLAVQDEAAFTAGTSDLTPGGGVYNDTLGALTSGQQGMFRISPYRSMYTTELDYPATSQNISAADVATTTTTGQGGQSLITGTPTTNSAATFPVNGDSTYSLSISGTWSGTLVVEKSVDGSTFTPIYVMLTGVNGNQSMINSITSNCVAHGNDASIAKVRVRCTSYTSGTATITLISGNGANLVAVGNNPSALNYQPATTAATFTTSSTTTSALAANCLGMGTALVTIVETGTTTTAGALIFEGYDGTTWLPVQGDQQNTLNPPVSSYTLVNGTTVQFSFDIAAYQQFRVRVSTVITGTGSPQAAVTLSVQASDNITSMPVGLAQRLDPVNDSITAYPFGHSYTNITTATTTTAKSGAGVLHSITCNTPVASAVLTLYDNTAGSGTKMRTITLPATLLAEGVYGVIVDEAYSTGLTAVTTGTADWTLAWR